MPPVTVSASVTTATTTTQTGAAEGLPAGTYVRAVTLDLPGGETVPHGRIYAWVELLFNGVVVDVPWRGYIVSTVPLTCAPDFWVPVAGFTMRVRATQTPQGAALVLRARALCDTQPSGASSRYAEDPGSGPGELRHVDLGNPAAGAQYGVQTVPATSRWLVEGLEGGIVTAIAAGNRVPRVTYDNGASRLTRTASGTVIGANVTYSFYAAPDYDSVDETAQNIIRFPLPRLLLLPGHRVTVDVLGLDAGDDLDTGNLGVREWAVP